MAGRRAPAIRRGFAPRPVRMTVRGDGDQTGKPIGSRNGAELQGAGVHPARRLRVLTVTCSYPNPCEPGYSPFVRARLQRLAELADVRVMAPVPLIDWGNPKGRLWQSFSIPGRRRDGPIEVLHPKWAYPPGGTPVNVACLFARLVAPVRRLCRRPGVDVIDSHFLYPDGVAAVWLARAVRRPCVVTLRGNEMANAEHPLRRRLMRWAAAKATALIAVSGELHRFAVSLGAPPERVRTVPNGVDTSRFYPRDRRACRERFSLAPEEKVILSAGALIPRKGHHFVVQALGALARRGLDATLLIAGEENRDGRFEKQIRRTVAETGVGARVRFLGFLDHDALAAAMSAADVLCLASSAEGWPNVVHEALACGTPVVATRVGAVPEMIPSGDYGLVVTPGSQTELELALEEALRREWDREEISRHGRARSWRRVAAEVLDVLAAAAAGSGRKAEAERR